MNSNLTHYTISKKWIPYCAIDGATASRHQAHEQAKTRVGNAVHDNIANHTHKRNVKQRRFAVHGVEEGNGHVPPELIPEGCDTLR